MIKNKVPVLIVGAGPVGLALAGDLGWRGVQCRLIEKTDGSIYQPKMDMVGIRTMEFCRRWGIVEWVENSVVTFSGRRQPDVPDALTPELLRVAPRIPHWNGSGA